MKPLFEIPVGEITTATKNNCPKCSHPKDGHCTPGKDGFWIRRGRFKTLLRCQHSASFATDERATCTTSSCVLCPCPGLPAKPKRKKKEVVA
jgi:hypothetical protein